jgi:hypothetical protein
MQHSAWTMEESRDPRQMVGRSSAFRCRLRCGENETITGLILSCAVNTRRCLLLGLLGFDQGVHVWPSDVE